MAKRGGFPGMGGFGGMNINNLMKEAKKMQADIEKSQVELAQKEFAATAGGGAISVKVSGDKTLKEIKTLAESKGATVKDEMNIVFTTNHKECKLMTPEEELKDWINTL